MKESEEHINALISNYFSGNSTQNEAEELSEWVNLNSDNRDYYLKLKNIWEISHPAFNPAEIDTSEAFKKVNSQINTRNWNPSRWMYYWQQAVAILILPLIAFSIHLYLKKSKEIQENVCYQEIFSPYGTYSFITLPDSSKVWLNAGTSLKYPISFQPGERVVSLNGEAFFEVKSDKKNPFFVKTEHSTVKATGTAFNVEAYSSDSIVAITLVSGIVDVSFLNHSEVINLTPGERLGYNPSTSQYSKVNGNLYKWYAWKDGKMIFRDDPLEYVFKRLEKTFNVDIEIKNQNLSKQLYRATFENESLDEILRLLQLTAPIQYKEITQGKNKDNSFEKRTIEVWAK